MFFLHTKHKNRLNKIFMIYISKTIRAKKSDLTFYQNIKPLQLSPMFQFQNMFLSEYLF